MLTEVDTSRNEDRVLRRSRRYARRYGRGRVYRKTFTTPLAA